jgi:hypothetical protein
MALGVTSELEPMRKSALFIAELYEAIASKPIAAIADSVFDRAQSIFAFSIAAHPTTTANYWINWGGTWDTPTQERMQIFMDFFLQEVFDAESLVLVLNSYWIDSDNFLVYMHLPLNPWQYFTAFAAIYANSESTFSTGPKNPENPSDQLYGVLPVRPVMSVPSIQNKISDAISGIVTYNSFTISADNSDGYYDTFDVLKFFNTPMQVSKTTEAAQLLDDFNIIRRGIINDIKVSFDRMEVEATDQLFLFNKPYCRKITVLEFPNVQENNLNADIPVAWGPVYNIKAIEVGRDTAETPTWIDYIVLDREYITALDAVYDSDGVEITGYTFDVVSGVFRVTEVDGDGNVKEAETADATGRENNLLGEIVIDALLENENIPYVAGFWDLVETDYYISISDELGFYFDGGTTRELISNVLRNDTAFLIQKNSGHFTIRRWGLDYETWRIPAWVITKKPQKNFQDATRFFCSSCRIKYQPRHEDDDFALQYLNDMSERTIFEEYRKSFTADFETDHIDEISVNELTERILSRFGQVRETVSLGLGIDTFQINPLDKITLDIEINGRQFSQYGSWIVKSVDPGQDTIVIEGLELTEQFTLDFDVWTENNLLLDGENGLLDGEEWMISNVRNVTPTPALIDGVDWEIEYLID